MPLRSSLPREMRTPLVAMQWQNLMLAVAAGDARPHVVGRHHPMGRPEQHHPWLLQEQTSDCETASTSVGILSLRRLGTNTQFQAAAVSEAVWQDQNASPQIARKA